MGGQRRKKIEKPKKGKGVKRKVYQRTLTRKNTGGGQKQNNEEKTPRLGS